ncbi:amidohydrolase family protein [Pseudahrensia aquimaris]|uniref:Amidohydrolase family protein n=1 Tax=Pseudahrensia aquimaris TaxID=744461 RepID=A0ABW3FBH5_9HYPH
MTLLPKGAWDTHCHVFPEGFPAVAGKSLPDGGGSLDSYRRVCAQLGIERSVFVQANAHGLDNSSLIHTLGKFGPDARGVAAVAPGTAELELQALHDAGIRGARVMDLGGGAVPLSQVLETVAMVRPLGWTTIVQFNGNDLLQHEETLQQIEGDWVLDHFGKFITENPSKQILTALKRLMDGGAHVKFAAPYEFSRSGAPDFADVAAIARELLDHRPDRVVWGSNWPHILNAPDDKPNDIELTEQVLGWIEPEFQEAVFVTTPHRLFG